MNGYIYFIISRTTRKIYVGQAGYRTKKRVYTGEGDFAEYTKWPERIDQYKGLFHSREWHRDTNTDKTRKHFEGSIRYYSTFLNKGLVEDVANMDNTFEIQKFETNDHVSLERTYIRYLIQNGYSLYNKHLYPKHEWSPTDIDPDVIATIESTLQNNQII